MKISTARIAHPEDYDVIPGQVGYTALLQVPGLGYVEIASEIADPKVAKMIAVAAALGYQYARESEKR